MNNFNNIEHVGLRAYNRMVNYINLIASHETKEKGLKYLSQFTKQDCDDIRNVLKQIEENGYENTRRSIIESAGLQRGGA